MWCISGYFEISTSVFFLHFPGLMQSAIPPGSYHCSTSTACCWWDLVWWRSGEETIFIQMYNVFHIPQREIIVQKIVIVWQESGFPFFWTPPMLNNWTIFSSKARNLVANILKKLKNLSIVGRDYFKYSCFDFDMWSFLLWRTSALLFSLFILTSLVGFCLFLRYDQYVVCHGCWTLLFLRRHNIGVWSCSILFCSGYVSLSWCTWNVPNMCWNIPVEYHMGWNSR